MPNMPQHAYKYQSIQIPDHPEPSPPAYKYKYKYQIRILILSPRSSWTFPTCLPLWRAGARLGNKPSSPGTSSSSRWICHFRSLSISTNLIINQSQYEPISKSTNLNQFQILVHHILHFWSISISNPDHLLPGGFSITYYFLTYPNLNINHYQVMTFFQFTIPLWII